MERFVALTERLRAPGGCPWDGEQTHHSLARYALEEAYEVVDAIDALPAAAPAPGLDVEPAAYAALEEELGDLLYQVVFHATLAREAGAFTTTEVVDGIHDKLVRRHPHVFGTVDASTASQVVANWEQLKRAEKGRASVMAGVDPSLPSLLYAHKLLGKAASVGIERGSAADEAANVRAAADELVHVAGDAAEDALARLLAAAVALARAKGLDGETVLRGWSSRFRTRFETMEGDAAARGLDITTADRAAVRAWWDETEPG
jgi:tetrapyrrole methylase family protein/MazG family protein